MSEVIEGEITLTFLTNTTTVLRKQTLLWRLLVLCTPMPNLSLQVLNTIKPNKIIRVFFTIHWGQTAVARK